MKSKFDFYEVVKVITSDPNKTELYGKLGYIRGKSEPEDDYTKRHGYAVLLFDREYLYCFEEDELESTGEFFDKSTIPDYGRIRVVVNEKGEGSVKASYSSYAEIKDEIINENAAKVSGHMIEAGMVSSDLDDLYELIDLCLNSNNSAIHVAGYTALWHLLLRYKNKLDHNRVFTYLSKQKKYDSEILEIINLIMDDLFVINKDLWQKINSL